jgi:hypothetical protein
MPDLKLAAEEEGDHELLQLRNMNSGGRQVSKSHWEIIANSSAVTALITVAGTAVLGTWLASTIQDRSRRAERSLVEHKEHVNAEVEIVRKAYDLAGKYIAGSEDLIAITGPEFNPRRFEGEQRRDLEKQKAEIRRQYNLVDAEWRHNRESLGYLIGYYHGGRQDVKESWAAVTKAMEAYNGCASNWSNFNPVASKEMLASAPCARDKEEVQKTLNALNATLEKVHSDLREE